MSHIDKVIDADPHFVIDPVTRDIKNESSKKTSLVQYDHNSERFSFALPRFVEGHDMLKCNSVKVNYINIDTNTKAVNDGAYTIKDLAICEKNAEEIENVCCTWIISQEATKYAGILQFALCFSCVAEDGKLEYAWNTNPFTSIHVSVGINNAEKIVEQYADVLEQWKIDLFSLSAEGVENINTAKAAALAEVQTAKAESLTEIDTSKDNACVAVEQKGKSVLESIPNDYVDLSNDLKNIKNDLYGETNENKTDYLLDGGIELFPEDGIYNTQLKIYKQNGVFRPRTGAIEISGEEDITVRVLDYADNGVTASGNITTLSVVLLDADKQAFKSLGTLLFYGVNEDGTVIETPSNSSAIYPTKDLSHIELGINGEVYHRDLVNGGICIITADQLEGAKYIDIHGLRDGQEISIKVWQGENPADNDTQPFGLAYDVEQLKEQSDTLKEQVSDVQLQVEGIAEDLDDLKSDIDIVEGNEALIATVFGEGAGGVAAKYATDFATIALADLHKEFYSLDDAICVKDIVTRPSQTPPLVILTVGDNLKTKPRVNGELSSDIEEYMEKAIEYGVYHTLGNHDVGGTTNKNECLTHDEVFNTYIVPMRDKWGLPNLDTIYFYKDFPSTRRGYGTRLISLYQYDIPLVDDETDNTKYKYSRVLPFFGQEQLNWFVDTLANTPENYRVIIMMHEQESNATATESVFNDSERNSIGTSPIYMSAPISSIVDAYIKKTTLTKTFTPFNTTKYPDSRFVVTVNADFSEAKGEFAHYLTGHIHHDFVGIINNTQQRHIVLTASCGQSMDCYVRATAGNINRSIVNLFGYDYKNNFVRLGRVGQQYTLTGQIRVLENVTLTKTE